jgi:MFS family permease
VASIIAAQFFARSNDATAYIFALLVFAVGFAVRPLGGLVFGAMGDRIGRKKTFLATMVLMGCSTIAIGLLPTRDQVGILAPVLLIVARLLQGLAIGGEYGGAAIYVAEHIPEGRRGLFTSFIQVTATAGLLLSLVVTFSTRTLLGEDAFVQWGWRIPFILSAVLLGVSMWLRLQLRESPEFSAAANAGTLARSPLRESVTDAANIRRIAVALFGLCAGMTAVWYTSQFYALFFMERMLKLDSVVAIELMTIALVLATPFFVLFGWLSDQVGRKVIILTGCLLAAVGYPALFQVLTGAVNPTLQAAQSMAPVTVVAAADTCSLQFDPIGRSRFLSSCDIAKAQLTQAGVSYRNTPAAAGAIATITVGSDQIDSFEGTGLAAAELSARRQIFTQELASVLRRHGYPEKADASAVHRPAAIGALFVMLLFATMCYGPLAAALSEMFPTALRYTSVSLPYNIATGWIGGFLPAAAFAIVAASGNIYSGLWYPIAFAALTVIIGTLFLPNTVRHRQQAKISHGAGLQDVASDRS